MRKYALSVFALLGLVIAFNGLITFLQAAEIIYVEGTVQVQSPQAEEWMKADKGTKVNNGDLIRTARRSRAEIALDDAKKNIVKMDPRTQIVLNSISEGSIDRIDLTRGQLFSNLEDIKSGLTYEVSTPSAVAGVRGSSYSVKTTKSEDEVVAYKDSVYIKTYDADKKLLSEVTMPEGFKTFIDRFETPTVLIHVSMREMERYDRMMEDVSAHAEGRESGRAERERKEAEAQKQAPQTQAQKTEAAANQVDSQTGITKTVSDSKNLVEESNVIDKINERIEEHEEH